MINSKSQKIFTYVCTLVSIFIICSSFVKSEERDIYHTNRNINKYLDTKAHISKRSINTGFSTWSYWSKCNRPCDGGIRTRRRACLAANCEGAKNQYKICNMKTCTTGSGDFREEQCARRNGRTLAGRLGKTWIPAPGYYECEVKCKSVDEGETYVFGKVEDGTKCGPDNNNVCLDGRCMPVDCDFIVGSSRVIDKCGVCGGHNSTCTEFKGSFRRSAVKWKSDEGYQEVIRLPVGSFNILVKDNTSNHLALKNSKGKFIFNGHKIIGWPGTYGIGNGMAVDYSRVAMEETLTIKGPIKHNLTVMALIVDNGNNPGIYYQYFIPKYNHNKYRHISNGGRSYPAAPTASPSIKSTVSPSKSRNDIPNEIDTYGPAYNEVNYDGQSTPDRNEIKRGSTTLIDTVFPTTYRQTPPSIYAYNISTTLRPRYPAKGNQGESRERPSNRNNRYPKYDSNLPRRVEKPIRSDNSTARKQNKNKNQCPPCERVKNRLKHFCTSDFVIRGKITNSYYFRELPIKEFRYEVTVLESYKTSLDLVLNPREYIWSPSPDACACPRLRKGIEYILMGKVDKNYKATEARLTLEKNSFMRKFNNKREQEMKILKELKETRCSKYVPKRKRY